jgi:RNA-directed DNA polymerase
MMEWKYIEFYIFKLQKKIYQASKNNNELEMVRLQKILLSSNAATLKAVRRVTQGNLGKKTVVVDNVRNLEQKKTVRTCFVSFLDGKNSLVRRVYIPNEKMSIDHYEYLALFALEPQWEAPFEPNSYGFRSGQLLSLCDRGHFHSYKSKALICVRCRYSKMLQCN